MKYFIDLDNTLCYTENDNYKEAQPYIERIKKVNQLKKEGHYIVIWTDRCSNSKSDYTKLTIDQLTRWDVQYNEIKFGKPDYDIYIDDKSQNVELFWKQPKNNNKSKKENYEIVEKGWGKEIIFANNENYCGKILCFEKGKKFSMHYHVLKKKSWYVSKGQFILSWIEPQNGTITNEYLNVGDVITNNLGEAHQLEALEDGEIFEVSTKHYGSDSYRIWKGD